MARIKRFSPKEDLRFVETFLIDEQGSSQYFKIKEFKEVFTGGKNGFLIEGSPFLKETTEIKIEIIDVDGNPVYYQPGDGIPEYYEGLSKVVSVYVYEDTPIGTAKITILGELKEYIDETGLVTEIPDEWKGVYNVKWEREFTLNKNLPNEDKVRFFRRPKVNIDEITKPIFNVETVSVTQSGSVNGFAQSPAEGSLLTKYNLPTSYKIVKLDGAGFSGSMVGSQIQFDGLDYSPIITDVVSEGELIVDTPYIINGAVSKLENIGYTASFDFVDTENETQSNLVQSFAKINITDMRTFVGDVARVKVYRKSKSSLRDALLTCSANQPANRATAGDIPLACSLRSLPTLAPLPTDKDRLD